MKALLVIDVQREYMDKYPLNLLMDINKRILQAKENKELIVYIKNIKKLRSGTKIDDFADELEICSSYIFNKEKTSAFSNDELYNKLQKNHIKEIEIIGVDGNSCIACSAIDSFRHGYKTYISLRNIGIINKERFEKKRVKLENDGIIFF